MAWGTYGRVKRLMYRDLLGSSQEAHAAHWIDFEWEAGRVIVASTGPWGCMQVWAATEAEGKRVIRHAAAISGAQVDDPNKGVWIVRTAKPGRNGQGGTMRTRMLWELPVVTKRAGPNGFPWLEEPPPP